MSQQNETGVLSIEAGAARGIYTRVYNSSGTWTIATASYAALGVQQMASLASTDIVPLRLCTAPGTKKMIASGVIAIGGTCYAAASGKVAATGTIIEGIALEAAATDGDIIEVMPIHNTDVSVASTGTTAATFQVDSDVGKPRAGLKSQTGGTGDYVAYYQAPSTLTADRTYTGPADSDQTLVGATATQTLTNKTLTTPIIGSGGVRGGSVQHCLRHRVTVAEINAGHELLAAISGYKYRIHDMVMIAIGGAVGTATTIDILGTQGAASVKLLAVAIAALTQSAVVRAGAANATVLADGASSAECDANTAITIGKTGGAADTATHVDVLIEYEVIAA